MPRVIPAATLSDLQKHYVAVAQLVSLDTTPATRWCKPWSQGRSLVVDGNTYTPRSFSVTGLVAGDVKSAGATFVFDNRDKGVSNLIVAGNDLTALVLTYTVLVKEHWEDDWQEAYVPLVAGVTSASGTLQTWTLVVGVGQSLHAQAGLRTGEVYCQHRYKGIWCQYAGIEVTCDRLYATCLLRGNNLHYGGLRLCPQPGDSIMLAGGISHVPGDPRGGAIRLPHTKPFDEGPPLPIVDGDSSSR